MAASVYLETTIVSYLTAWRSPDLVMAAKQQLTRQWWDESRHLFDLFVSDVVLLEAAAGDTSAAQRRMEVLESIPVLSPIPQVDQIASKLVERLSLPDRATADAAHIAICVAHGIDFLVTWNCTHIANAAYQPIIQDVCDTFGFGMPVVCTPEQLMGNTDVT